MKKTTLLVAFMVAVLNINAQHNLEVIGDTASLQSPDGSKTIMLRTAGADGELKSIGDLYLRGQNSNIYMNHTMTDGNVAIGTLAPGKKLTVEGSILAVGDTVMLQSPNGMKTIMMRTEGADGELKSLGDLYLRSQSNDIYMNHTPVDGNVTIGTLPPSKKLNVEGSILAVGDSITLESSNGMKTVMMRTEGADGELQSVNDLYLRANGDDIYMNHVGTDGNVTIGTLPPSKKLNVDGSILAVGDSITLESSNGMKTVMMRTEGADGELQSMNDLYLRANGDDIYMNHVATDGNVTIGTLPPSKKLNVDGSILAVGDSVTLESVDGTKAIMMRTTINGGQLESITDLHLRGIGSDILMNIGFGDGDVGVGVISPLQKFDVGGGIHIGNTTINEPGSIRYTGFDFEGYLNSGWTSLTSGGGSSVWSQNGTDTYISSLAAEVGIGTGNPTSTLHVIGDDTAGETVDITNNADMLAHSDILNLSMSSGSSDDAQFLECRRFADLMFRVNGDGSMWAGIDKVIIDGGSGDIDLSVGDVNLAQGDVYITDSTKGVILTSPNGSCWRMTIDDTGTQVITSITCP